MAGRQWRVGASPAPPIDGAHPGGRRSSNPQVGVGRDPRRTVDQRKARRGGWGTDESLRAGAGRAGGIEGGRKDMTARREDRRSKPTPRLTEQEVELERLRAEVAAWRARAAPLPTRNDAAPISASGRVVEPVYTVLDLPSDSIASTGLPGNYPYTRGIHPTMYRGRLWTMRQFAGFGTAEDTNARY